MQKDDPKWQDRIGWSGMESEKFMKKVYVSGIESPRRERTIVR